ncbi:MAG TPA: UDP binding domain-containing protein [Candidatus Limnocylindrales bacterium]|nr:UDP binding domain-containing protein [Candidatus Limnocylindrales bacterium]
MPNVLNLKPDDIDTNEKRSKYTVSVVGCGQKGILFACAFAEAGFRVSCSDADPSVVKRLAKGKTPFRDQEIEGKIKSLISAGQLTVTGELKKAASRSDVIIITVPSRVDDKKKIDSSEALNTIKQVGEALRSGVLVVYGEVAGLGFIEGMMKETLENTSALKAGQDFSLAYIPIHNSQVKLVEPITDLQLKVAVVGKTSQDATLNFVKTIAKNVKQVNDVKTAEIAALFTVARQDTNSALASELALFCESASVDCFEVLKWLECSDMSFWPTTVDEENKNEAYLLLETAENLNAKLNLSLLARKINEEMVKHAVTLAQGALRNCNKTLRRARVAILGSVNSNETALALVKLLQLKGAKVCLYDPASRSDAADLGVVKTSLNEALEGVDCTVILTGEEQFKHLNLRKLKALMKTPSVIVDLAGAFGRKEVEAEGFIYRGLGKGA